MIGNYFFFKGALSFNMLLQILCILLELESYEGLDTNYLTCVSVSLFCLSFPLCYFTIISYFCKHSAFPTHFFLVLMWLSFLRDWSCGVVWEKTSNKTIQYWIEWKHLPKNICSKGTRYDGGLQTLTGCSRPDQHYGVAAKATLKPDGKATGR